MALDDDIALFRQVPTLALLGDEALRILAIGAESQVVPSGTVLFYAGEPGNAGYVIHDGAMRLLPGTRTVSLAKTFSGAALIGHGWNGFRSVAGVGDLDGDGKPDLIGVSATGAPTFFAGTGDAGKVSTGYSLTAIAIGRGWDIFR